MGIEMSSARRDRPAVEKPGETEEMRAEIRRLKVTIGDLREELAQAVVTIGEREREANALSAKLEEAQAHQCPAVTPGDPELRQRLIEAQERLQEAGSTIRERERQINALYHERDTLRHDLAKAKAASDTAPLHETIAHMREQKDKMIDAATQKFGEIAKARDEALDLLAGAIKKGEALEELLGAYTHLIDAWHKSQRTMTSVAKQAQGDRVQVAPKMEAIA